jgi:hypothetical protein
MPRHTFVVDRYVRKPYTGELFHLTAIHGTEFDGYPLSTKEEAVAYVRKWAWRYRTSTADRGTVVRIDTGSGELMLRVRNATLNPVPESALRLALRTRPEGDR